MLLFADEEEVKPTPPTKHYEELDERDQVDYYLLYYPDGYTQDRFLTPADMANI